MTVPTPPSTNAPVQGGGAKGWGRPAPTSPRTAEEDFGRQLAGIAAGGDRGGKRAAAVRDGVADASMARLQTGDFDWARARGLDDIAIASGDAAATAAAIAADADINASGDETVAGDIAAAGEAAGEAAAPVAAMSPVTAAALPLAVPLHGQQVREQAAPPVSSAPRPVEAKLRRILMDAPEPARPDAMPLAARAPADPSTPAVNVVSRETHLPPAAMPVRDGTKVPVAEPATLPVRENAKAPVAEGQASREVVDLPAGEVRPAPTVSQQSQARDTRQWPGQGSQPGPFTQEPAAAEDAQPAVDATSQTLGTRDAQGLPQSTSSPLRQIADKIVSELQSPADTSRPSPVPAPASPAPHTVLKVLTIQLHPAELGAVTVRIALRDDALELQIEAGRQDTARLVEADRDGLSSHLRLAGYSVETMVVRAVEMPSAAAQAGSSPMSADGGATQTQSGGAQGNAGASGGRNQPNHHGNHHLAPRHRNDEPDSTRRRLGDGLYL